MTRALPIAMIVMQLGAAVVYASHGDVRKVVYWLAAAALNAAVTF